MDLRGKVGGVNDRELADDAPRAQSSGLHAALRGSPRERSGFDWLLRPVHRWLWARPPEARLEAPALRRDGGRRRSRSRARLRAARATRCSAASTCATRSTSSATPSCFARRGARFPLVARDALRRDSGQLARARRARSRRPAGRSRERRIAPRVPPPLGEGGRRALRRLSRRARDRSGDARRVPRRSCGTRLFT